MAKSKGFNFHIDMSELTDFQQDMLTLSDSVKNGRYTKQFLRRTGSKGMRRVRSTAKSRIKKEHTGNLMKGFKRGRVYFHSPSDAYAVRVYAGSPAFHANLLEYGHHIYLPPHKTYWGYFKGYNFFRDGMKIYEPVFYNDVGDFVEELIYKHLL